MIKQRIQSKGDDLKMLQGHDRLAYLIDIAKDVPQLPDEVKIDQNKIRGCASNLWLIGGAKEDIQKQHLKNRKKLVEAGVVKGSIQ